MVSFNKYRIWLENDLYLLEISSFAHLKRFEGTKNLEWITIRVNIFDWIIYVQNWTENLLFQFSIYPYSKPMMMIFNGTYF